LIHRDLKSPNVMLSSQQSQFDAKVCDFGLSGMRSVVTGRAVENPVWLAPEILRNDLKAQQDPTKIDVYAYGVILWELVTRADFFGEIRFMFELEQNVINGKRPSIPATCHPQFENLIQLCWQDDPIERPSFDEILEELILIKKSFRQQDELRPSKDSDEESILNSKTATITG